MKLKLTPAAVALAHIDMAMSRVIDAKLGKASKQTDHVNKQTVTAAKKTDKS